MTAIADSIARVSTNSCATQIVVFDISIAFYRVLGFMILWKGFLPYLSHSKVVKDFKLTWRTSQVLSLALTLECAKEI